MNSKLLKSRDRSSLLASRDKSSVVRSFQEASFKESRQKKSKQRASRTNGDTIQDLSLVPQPAIAIPRRIVDDAEKLAKDAGGK